MQRIAKAGLTATVAVVSALAPAVATAAERPQVTLDPTARIGAAPSAAVVSGTYTCRGVKGDAQLNVTLRTRRDRTPTPAEAKELQQLYGRLGLGNAPSTLSNITSRTRTVAVSCDGSSTVRPWKRSFTGEWKKGGTAEASVTMITVELPLRINRLADASRTVTFS